jgi:hypothetical protein
MAPELKPPADRAPRHSVQRQLLARHPDPTVLIHTKMELFISKLRELDLPSISNILRFIAIPATVKLHKGFFPAVLCQVGNQTHVVGLCLGNVLVGVKACRHAVPEATPAPDV